MHKSRLSGFIIDCQTDDLEGAAAFWGAALGLRVEADAHVNEALYRKLLPPPNGMDVEVQKVEHPSRVHLDIETDDVEAEVQRLERLGARRVTAVHGWWVLEAPTGQRFCVVPATRPGFAASANTWG
jgi:hypothetical protein